MQHFIVAIVFALCLYWVIRRIAHIVSRARKGEPRCGTCTETNCPLHQAYANPSRDCDCGGAKKEKTEDTVVCIHKSRKEL